MNKQVIVSKHSRRYFIKYSSLAIGGTVLTGPYLLRGQNLYNRMNIAQIGCGGKGGGDMQLCGAHDNIVAVCDVNTSATDRASQDFPKANVYKDFRLLFEKEKSLDAVDIATPDHMHAVIAAMAMKMGKHVYCQKPLTHDVYEARTLRELAKEHKVATQMGNQGSASDGLRRAVGVVQAGLIGPVHQAYVWTNRPIWPQGRTRPPGSDPVPDNLDWDLWLGTAPYRPFKLTWPNEPSSAGRTNQAIAMQVPAAGTNQAAGGGTNQFGGRGRRGGRGGGGRGGGGGGGRGIYQPFNWRGWLDFGTGALGDMACHTTNWPFRALNLGYPTEIEATSSGMNGEMYPTNSRIRFEFPARTGMPPVTLWWSDGGNLPPTDVTADISAMLGDVSRSGCIMIGDKGMVYSGDDGDQDLRFYVKLKGDKEMMGSQNHEAVRAIPELEPYNGFGGSSDARQHQEWIAACKGVGVGYSNFDIAAYLTEIMLLGCVALRVGRKIEWDGPKMRATNAPEAAHYVKREYRKGWKL